MKIIHYDFYCRISYTVNAVVVILQSGFRPSAILLVARALTVLLAESRGKSSVAPFDP